MKFLESTTVRPSVNAAAILGFGDRRCLSQDHRHRQGNMHQEQVHRHGKCKKKEIEKLKNVSSRVFELLAPISMNVCRNFSNEGFRSVQRYTCVHRYTVHTNHVPSLLRDLPLPVYMYDIYSDLMLHATCGTCTRVQTKRYMYRCETIMHTELHDLHTYILY